MKQNKEIEKIPITFPDHNYQPKKSEMVEEVHFDVSPDELAEMVVRDYDIKFEKGKKSAGEC